MPNRTSQSKLRNYIKGLREDLFTALQYLWQVCEELHENQNRGDGTDNGRRHVEKVEAHIWRLIKDSEAIRITDFLPEELFVLSAASCCHDLDKALKKYDEDSWPYDLVHGSGSADFVMKNHQAIGFSGMKNLAHRVCEVCRAHPLSGTAFQETVGTLSTKTATPGGPINMHRATVILKAADILHTDETRIHSTAFPPECLIGDAQSKYLARSCIGGWKVVGDTLVIEAEYDTDKQLGALRACEDFMTQTEWPCVATFLETCSLPSKLKFSIKHTLRGAILMSNLNIIEVDRTRNFGIEVTKNMLKLIGQLSNDYVCRNQYVLHAMGSAVMLLAVDVVVERLRYVQRSFDKFYRDLVEEEVYSLEKLGEHIKFLSHLRSILSQLIKECLGESNGEAARRDRHRTGVNTLAKAIGAVPGCKEIIRDDLSDIKRRLVRETDKLNEVLLKVERRVVKLPQKERESARRDPRRYSSTIRPPMKIFFPILRDMGESTTIVADKFADVSDKIIQDWNNDIGDILLVDEKCRVR